MTPGALIKAVSAQLAAPHWRLIWIASFALLAFTRHRMFSLLPFDGAPDLGAAFTLLGSGLAFVVGITILAVAALRIAGNSPRSPWAMNTGWWLFLLIGALLSGLPVLSEAIIGAAALPQLAHFILSGALAAVAALVFARWMAAIAIDGATTPPLANILALRTHFAPAALWTAIVAGPLSGVHSLVSQMATMLPAQNDLYLALIDAAASTAMLLFALALMVVLYRDTDIEPKAAAS